MKKIMIIGASWEQVPLIKKAKEMGFYIIATHTYPNAEGFEFANETYVIDSRDLLKFDELFQKAKPDAVIADACDYSMCAVAFLTAKYNLPGPNLDSLLVTNNKYLQRQCAKIIKIPQPRYRLCMTYEETKKALDELGLPVMIKPLDNRGSIGICRVEKKSDLKKAFLEAMANSHSRQILVETSLPGKVVTVEGIIADKFYNLSFSTKKMHPQYPDNAMHLQYPGNLPQALVRRLYNYNKKLVKQIGINFGLTHSEFIVDSKNVYFLEIANRGGGVHISNIIIPAITGIDTSKLLILGAYGKKLKKTDISLKNKGRYSYLHFFDFGVGKVRKIHGLEQAKTLKGVLAIRLNFKAGDILKSMKTAVQRPGFVIVVGDSLNSCDSLLDKVEKTITVELDKSR